MLYLGIGLFVLSLALPYALKEAPKAAQMLTPLLRIVSVLLVLAGFAWSSGVIVPAGYRGVLLRFGAVHGVLPEGFNFIIPQMDAAQLLEVRTQKEETQSAAASKDLQTVTTTMAVNYHLSPEGVGDLYKRVGAEYKNRIIDPIAQESLKAVTARYTAEELIRLRDKVKSEVQTEMTTRLQPYNIIVEPSGVSITNFAFGEEFNKAIEQKQVAQQTAEKQKYVLQQAQLEAQTAVTKAKGNAEAARINGSALQAQGGSRLLAREWIDKWDGKLPTVSGGGNGGMIVDLRDLMNNAPDGKAVGGGR